MSNDERQPTEEEQQQEHSPGHCCYEALRILVLHDGNSNAKEAHKLLADLDGPLFTRHALELLYVNSPLIIEQDDSTDTTTTTTTSVPPLDKDNLKRNWWEKTEQQEFLGLDASLLHIKQICKSIPTIIGVLGLGSQGATMASLLPPLLQPTLEFAIFCHGHAMMEDEERVMMEEFACLHLIREDNAETECVQRLVKQYPGQIHSSSTTSRSNSLLAKTDLNAIGKFLVQQKKRLLRADGSSSSAELVLQTKLHRVEQEASQLIAQEIAENPPKALMAVITPQGTVGGWSGRKRREFGAQGGGAPCPPEFLLNQTKRRDGDKNGPSRQHPSAKVETGGEKGTESEDDIVGAVGRKDDH